MDYLIMDYFKGISFIGYGDHPQYAGVQSRFFDGYYGIQYNHSGPMDFETGDSPLQHVDGPYAFISKPLQKFYYGAPSGKTRHHIFACFKGPLTDKFILKGLMELNRKEPLIKIVNSERFLQTFRELIANIRHNPPQNYDRAVLLLEDLMLQLHEQPTDKPEINSHLVPGLKQLENALAKNPQLEWNFFKEASSLGISYPHFRRIFRQYTGRAPGSHLIKCRLQNAALLLLHSNDQISAIAEKCGIPDEFYFSRLFKKHYKLPPKTFRKEFRNSP